MPVIEFPHPIQNLVTEGSLITGGGVFNGVLFCAFVTYFGPGPVLPDEAVKVGPAIKILFASLRRFSRITIQIIHKPAVIQIIKASKRNVEQPYLLINKSFHF